VSDLGKLVGRLVRGAVKELLEEDTTALARREQTTPEKVDEATGLPQEQLMKLLLDSLRGGNPVSTNVKLSKFDWVCPRCGCKRSLAMIGGMNPAHLGHNGEFDEEAFRRSLVCPECGATVDSL